VRSAGDLRRPRLIGEGEGVAVEPRVRGQLDDLQGIDDRQASGTDGGSGYVEGRDSVPLGVHLAR
jgi:hypothetical protein